MLKKLGVFITLLAVIIGLNACRVNTTDIPLPSKKESEISTEDSVIIEDETKSGKTNDVIDPEPGSTEKKITLYFSNNEYIMTGDESLDIIIPVKKKVLVGENPIEEIVVIELQNEPEDDKLTTSLANIEILSVDTVEKIAYVNISSKDLSGGSLSETLILQQLVYSLTELEEVEAVQILVDGSKRESLMGHISIQEPLTR